MDEFEQKREQRIGALRQVVSLLRGSRTATNETKEGWAKELEKLADEEAMEGKQYDSRVTYKNVMTYLRSELGFDRDKIKSIITEHVGKLVDFSLDKAVRGRVDQVMGNSTNSRLAQMVEKAVSDLIATTVRSLVLDEAKRMVTGRLDVVLRDPQVLKEGG